MIRSVLVLLALLVAPSCKRKHEGDVPLRVTNAPTCKSGTMTRQLLIRMENGSDFAQFPLDAKMVAANTWAGRKATVKVALCPPGPCPTPTWVRTTETKVGGGDDGLTLELPKVEVPCDDGTVGTN